ncbi:MAG: hypothetical protein LBE71_05315 [Dysgonamonadaceae bacterium]|nr:hypothetical protein [Dysgonamonadaceae bacterium]
MTGWGHKAAPVTRRRSGEAIRQTEPHPRHCAALVIASRDSGAAIQKTPHLVIARATPEAIQPTHPSLRAAIVARQSGKTTPLHHCNSWIASLRSQ